MIDSAIAIILFGEEFSIVYPALVPVGVPSRVQIDINFSQSVRIIKHEIYAFMTPGIDNSPDHLVEQSVHPGERAPRVSVGRFSSSLGFETVTTTSQNLFRSATHTLASLLRRSPSPANGMTTNAIILAQDGLKNSDIFPAV